MALAAGTRLGPYEILAPLGAGGMGEVFRARDPRLKRDVALKVLPAELASEPERLERFQREAETLAALNHPHIVTIFSVEETEERHFLTMELVEGKTLSKVIPRGGLPLSRFFQIAIPLTEAVSAAHDKGIIHRDLKPGNVMVTEEDRVKVLDFGLAKLREGVRGAVDTQSPTEPATGPGRVLGTAPYMSPEQVQGRTLDHRSDVFALGIMLYEMATGERPFAGDTFADVASSILKDTPVSVTERKADLPRDLGRLIKHGLEKEPRKRFQSTLDLANELEELRREVDTGEALVSSGAPITAKSTAGKRRLWLVGGAVVVALAVVAGGVWLSEESESLPRLSTPRQITTASEVEGYPSWRPDGTQLTYESNQNGNWDIWVTQVSGERAINLTEDYAGEDRFPSWSPDGSQIAFYSKREGGGYFVMPALGGRPRKVAVAPQGRRDGPPQWSPDGRRLAYVMGEPWSAEIVSIERGSTQRLALPGPESPRGWHLSWSPNGRFFAYTTAWDEWDRRPQVWVVRLADGQGFPVTEAETRGDTFNSSPSWSPDSRSLYFISNRGGSMDLWRRGIATDGTPAGTSQRLTTGVEMLFARFSPDGKRLAYSKGRKMANIWRVPILEGRPATWSDARQLTDEQGQPAHVLLSPDKTQLAFCLRGQEGTHIWRMAAEGGVPRRVLLDPMEQIWARWSPDGQRIAFHSDEEIWVVSPDGGQPLRLTEHEAIDIFPSWSPDGREIAFQSTRSGNWDVWTLPAQGGEARQITTDPAADEIHAHRSAWSPDGREIVFESTRSGNWDIWVIPSEGGEARQLTSDPAADVHPEWSHDGQWVVFDSDRAGGRLWNASAHGGGRLWRVRAQGGDVEPVLDEDSWWPIFSPGGNRLYFGARRGGRGNLYEKEFGSSTDRQLTDFAGRPGYLTWVDDTDGEFLYFTWSEDHGDLWVMDVDGNQ